MVLQIQQLLVYGEGDSKTRQQVSITAPHRTYKTEGALFFINAQKQQVACHVFLFNDMLLITKPRKTSSGKLQYELKKQFALADCTLEPNLSATSMIHLSHSFMNHSLISRRVRTDHCQQDLCAASEH